MILNELRPQTVPLLDKVGRLNREIFRSVNMLSKLSAGFSCVHAWLLYAMRFLLSRLSGKSERQLFDLDPGQCRRAFEWIVQPGKEVAINKELLPQ